MTSPPGSLLCGPGSARMPRRAPSGGAFCRRGASYFLCSSTSLMTVATFCPRVEWCVAPATAIATAILSCRSIERTPEAGTLCAAAHIAFDKQQPTARTNTRATQNAMQRNLFEPGGGWVGRSVGGWGGGGGGSDEALTRRSLFCYVQRCTTHHDDANQEHLGVKLPASPPPPSPRPTTTVGCRGLPNNPGLNSMRRSPKKGVNTAENPFKRRQPPCPEMSKNDPGRRCMTTGTLTTFEPPQLSALSQPRNCRCTTTGA